MRNPIKYIYEDRNVDILKKRNEQFASEPYGLALKRILAERKISISTLAQKLNLASRNTIYRVLAGSSKYESAEKLHQRICENQPQLHFREEEMQTLQDALERCRYGERGYAIRKMVMDLIIRPEHPVPAAPCICCTSTEPAWCERTLDEVMDALANYAEADVFLFDAPYPQLCDALQRLFALAETGVLYCRVQHVLSSTDDAFVEMQQFIQLRSLLSDPRYTCYTRIFPSALMEASVPLTAIFTACRDIPKMYGSLTRSKNR